MALGDSNTLGSNAETTGGVGGWRESAFAYLLERRSDFDVKGSVISQLENAASLLPFVEGHIGLSLQAAAAGFPGYYASPGVAPVDLVVQLLGAANVITLNDSVATMLAAQFALDQAKLAANPNISTIVLDIMPAVLGTSVSPADFATWNAKIQAFNTALQNTYVPPAPFVKGVTWVFRPVNAVLGPGEFYTDGLHVNQLGQGTQGQRIGLVIHQFLGIARDEAPAPTAFRQRKPASTIILSNPTTDGLTCTGHSGFNPGTDSFALAFDCVPISLPSNPGLGVLVSYGAYASVNDFFLITQQGEQVSVYWANQAGTIIQTAIPPGAMPIALQVGRRYRFVLMAHAPTGTVGLYINKRCVGIAQGVPPWSFGQHVLAFGPNSGGSPGVIGHYGRVHAYQGSAVPRPGSIEALLAVANDYCYGGALVPGAVSADFSLDGTLLDAINANPSMVLAGNAGFAAAAPQLTPPAPWEYPYAGAEPIVPIWSPRQLPHLVAWLRADALLSLNVQAILGWGDLSGNGNGCLGGGAQPLFNGGTVAGQPAVTFQAANLQILQFVNSFAALTSAHLFCIFQKIADPPPVAAKGGLFLFGTSGVGSYIDFTDGIIYDDSGSTTRKTAGAPVHTLAAPTLYEVLSAPGLWTDWVNGDQQFTTNVNTVSFPAGHGSKLGGSTDVGAYLDGWIAEFILCGSTTVGAGDPLSSGDVALLKKYLRDRYQGVQIN